MLMRSESKKNRDTPANWVGAISAALKNKQLAELNRILNTIPEDKRAQVLNTKSSFFGPRLVELIHRYDYEKIRRKGLENIPNRLAQANAVAFFSNILKELNARVIIKNKSNEIWTSCFLLPFLNECACGAYFNRLEHSRRSSIENKILSEVKRKFPITQFQTIHYLSFGSGYLLQDFVLILKLILEGYALNIVLIEQQKDQKDFDNALRQLHLLVYAAAEKNLAFKIRCFSTITHYVNQYPHEKIHLAHAIDIPPPLPVYDLIITHETLDTQGLFFVADKFHDFFFDKRQLFHNIKYHFYNEKKEYANLKLLYDYVQAIPEISKITKKAKFVKEVISKKNAAVNQEPIVRNILSYLGLFSASRFWDNSLFFSASNQPVANRCNKN